MSSLCFLTLKFSLLSILTNLAGLMHITHQVVPHKAMRIYIGNEKIVFFIPWEVVYFREDLLIIALLGCYDLLLINLLALKHLFYMLVACLWKVCKIFLCKFVHEIKFPHGDFVLHQLRELLNFIKLSIIVENKILQLITRFQWCIYLPQTELTQLVVVNILLFNFLLQDKSKYHVV